MTPSPTELQALLDRATEGPWKVTINGTLTGAWAEVVQECVDPETNEPWDRELFRSDTTHVRKADCYPPNGTFRDVNEAPDEWELTEDGEEHLTNARLIALAPQLASENIALHKEIERLREALRGASDAMTCRRDDDACYCPNCDNSLYEARDKARAALSSSGE